MPKKTTDKQEDPKPKAQDKPKHDQKPDPMPVEHVDIPQEQLPQDIGPRGDAEPAVEVHEDAAPGQPKVVDPLLDPSSQQPFESGEDYRRRVGANPTRPGVFDQEITRGRDPE